MATPVTWASVNQFNGIAKEITQGTPVAPTFTLFTDKFDWEHKPVYLDDKAFRGVMGNDSFNVIQGVLSSVLSMGGPVFDDGIGFPLGNILGDITTTGASAPFTHVISLLNTAGASDQPTSHTISHYYGPSATSGTRVFSGTCFSQIVLEFNAGTGLLTWTATATGWGSTIAGSRPTASSTGVKPVAAWVGKIGIGGPASGGTLNPKLESGKITINREVEPLYTATNVQQPYIIQRGGLSASFDATFVVADETEFLYMANNTQPQLQFVFSNGLAGAALASVQVDMQVGAFTSAKADYGEKAVRMSTSGKGVFNSTNVGTSAGLSPVQVTLQNAQASGTYV